MSDRKTFESGATSRSLKLDYSLCPKEIIQAITNRFEEGIKKGHARNNWKLGKNDPAFIKDRLNHGFEHYMKVMDGTGTREDFEAVVCNLAMVAWWLKNGNGAKEAVPHLFE